jgi:hypothetical protein
LLAAWILVLLPGWGDIASTRPQARLTVERSAPAQSCPDQETLARNVAERLGRRAFVESAEQAVTVSFDRRPDGGFSAHVAMRDERGIIEGERTLDDDGTDCADLGDVVALTLSVMLERAKHAPPPAESASTPPPPTTTEPPKPEPPEPAPQPPPRLRGHVRVEATLGAGIGPAPAPGGLVGLGLISGPWSLDVEGMFDFGAERPRSLRASLREGAVVPCLHFPSSPLGVCAVLGMGALSVEGLSANNPRSTSSFFADVGLRAALDVPLGSRLTLSGHLDGRVAITRITASIGATDVWTSGPAWALLGVGLGYAFP